MRAEKVGHFERIVGVIELITMMPECSGREDEYLGLEGDVNVISTVMQVVRWSRA